jgi:Flp pilus assembly pilin Flp
MTNLILSTIGAVMRDRRGVTSLEYGVIAAALIAAVTAAMTILSGDLQVAFGTLGSAIETAF